MTLKRPTLIALAAGLFSITQAPASALSGNPGAGQLIYRQCQICHSLKRHRTGPRHCGLIGRTAGSSAGFEFSPAMRNSGIVWTAETLDQFLTSPKRLIPGNLMGFGGVEDRQDRADLIAYLVTANRSANCGYREREMDR